MNEEVRKQMIYLASVDVLRRLLKSGKVEPQKCRNHGMQGGGDRVKSHP